MNYTVDNLLEKLGVVGNNKIWKEIPEGVTVKGIVSNITAYDKKSYFDLVGSGLRIRACCSSDETPSEGAAIEFSGIITLKTKKFESKLQVMINGSPVGTWERHKKSTVLTGKDLVKYNNMPLSSLIQKFETGRLLVVGSETAFNDVTSALSHDTFINIEHAVVAVSNKSKVLGLLKKVKDETKQYGGLLPAFAVVRGGDDDSMDVWDDPEVIRALLDVGIPYFTALGHSHRVTLADKYAAQSFPTPGNFGSSINHEVDNYQFSQSVQHDNKNLSLALKKNEAKTQLLEEQDKKSQIMLQRHKSSNKWLRIVLWLLVILLLSFVAVGGYMFITMLK